MEIKGKLELSIAEDNLLDMHSVLNVLNIVNYELFELSDVLGNPEPLENVISGIKGFAQKLRNRKEALYQIENVDNFIQNTLSAIDKVRTGRNNEEMQKIKETKENLDLIFTVGNGK